MEELSLPAIVGLATVLGTGHLCSGLAIGWYMGRQTRAPAATLNVAPIVASVDRLRGEIGELARLSKEQQASQEMASLIARIALSADELRGSVSNQPPSRPADTEPSHRVGTHAVSNARILEWFHGPTISQRPLGELVRRYPFAVKQLVAFRRSEDLPELTEFQIVQCHDLCPTEIRYIADDRPKVDELVIGLGLPRPVKFLAARIEDYRSVYMYGQVGYLVTAQFTAALDHSPYLAHCGEKVELATR